MSSDDNMHDEIGLWKQAGVGIVLAMIAFAILGFVMLSIGAPNLSFGAKFGTSLYIGFWGGPVFGMAGAVGYHHLTEAKQENKADSTRAEASKGDDRAAALAG